MPVPMFTNIKDRTQKRSGFEPSGASAVERFISDGWPQLVANIPTPTTKKLMISILMISTLLTSILVCPEICTWYMFCFEQVVIFFTSTTTISFSSSIVIDSISVTSIVIILVDIISIKIILTNIDDRYRRLISTTINESYDIPLNPNITKKNYMYSSRY